jgi:hypothetical protein
MHVATELIASRSLFLYAGRPHYCGKFCGYLLLVPYSITEPVTEPATSPSRPLFLGTTNLSYASSISSLLNKEPMYVMLASY